MLIVSAIIITTTIIIVLILIVFFPFRKNLIVPLSFHYYYYYYFDLGIVNTNAEDDKLYIEAVHNRICKMLINALLCLGFITENTPPGIKLSSMYTLENKDLPLTDGKRV